MAVRTVIREAADLELVIGRVDGSAIPPVAVDVVVDALASDPASTTPVVQPAARRLRHDLERTDAHVSDRGVEHQVPSTTPATLQGHIARWTRAQVGHEQRPRGTTRHLRRVHGGNLRWSCWFQ